ncbi:MAG TPA: HAMP domain-containing sensor histidine kinase [Bacilli bacterium]|jgi:signal transduction histidine kinase|nr:HAMP domain-containing sensor histidine kinase [Bacilli bacterium]HPZ23344.1 HAMP domain-containing sensor histidine kinase [Bacilli bacterium]HQC83545.1 HAMP domain-containing sensor histidine kinase [Bacilli bacterium]
MKKNSLAVRTLIVLSIFSIVILLLLWIIQIQFLNVFYEKYQTQNINDIANTIENMDNVTSDSLEEIAFKNNICIQYYTGNTVSNYNTMINGCILNNSKESAKYKSQLISSDNNYIRLNGPGGTKSLIYMVTLNDGYVFLNAPLEDLNTTTTLLRSQLIYIILLLILLSVLVAIFIAKMVNKPVLKLINSARELSKGNYNVKFEKSNIAELDELADVLTLSASEMNKTDELRRDLVANVSHDLKTPLTMIKAYAEKVRDLSYKDEEKRTHDLNVIIDESDRLNGLVNDLLELSKIQAHENSLDLVEYDLIEDIHEVLKRYDLMVDKDGYKFELDLPDKAYVRADRAKMDQVFYNLINNAIEHTGDDNVVKISVKLVKNYYVINITDTGKGISEEEIPLVWNRYYTKKKNYKRNTVGTGIGLSIVKGTFEKHNFEYGIDSKVGKYTTFYFKMPKVNEKVTK